MGYYLGLDASTQSMTGMIINTDSSQIIAEESINYDENFASKYGVNHGVLDKGKGTVINAIF